ncbi:hypothetical protein KAJ27_11445 [bacterium]|nr:hypothetical protein [bacterium]
MNFKNKSYIIFFTIYLLNKILVFSKELLVILYFGANFTTDCYYASVWYYQILFQILGGLFLQFVVVESKKYGSKKYDSSIFWGTFITIAVVCFLFIIFISPIVAVIGKHLPGKYHVLLKRIMVIQMLNNVVLIYFMFKKIFLVSDGEFINVGILEITYYSMSVIFFIVMYSLGVCNIIISVLSTTMALFIGYLIFYKNIRNRIVLIFPFNKILFNSIVRFFPIIVAMIVNYIYFFQLNFLVSILGEKSITNLFWGIKLVESFMSLSTGFITVILLPKLCELSDSEVIINLRKKLSKFVMFSILMFIIYMVSSVSLLYFLNVKSKYYEFLKHSYYFAFALPARIYIMIMIQYYFALRMYKSYSYSYCSFQILSIILNFALFSSFGFYGLGFSFVFTQYLVAFFMTIYIFKGNPSNKISEST